MDNKFSAPTTYFLGEGRENLRECLAIAFEAAKQHNIEKIVIFTAEGEGIRLALQEFSVSPRYQQIKLVGVTFPNGKQFTDAMGKARLVEIPRELERLFQDRNVPIIRAHLPFDPIAPPFHDRGVLAQDLSLVGEALNMFCGSMSLCVQAIVLATDAGAVALREHVIALTSDTAILAQATCTRRMLSDLIIREILCKPAVLTIGRQESSRRLVEVAVSESPKAITSGNSEQASK
jgi:hypothetical protein